MKRTLESLITAFALAGTSCVTATMPSHLPLSGQTADGKYDYLDNLVNVQDIDALKNSNYMILNESTYKAPDGKEVILQGFGTGVLYKDVGDKTYLVTANHVVHNDDILHDFFGNKYKKISEKFYLLDDNQVEQFQNILRQSSEEEKTQMSYLTDSLGKKRMIKTSAQGGDSKAIKAREVKTDAYNTAKDLAIVSVSKIEHQPLVYDVGDGKELQTQNLLYVVGWPLGLVKNVTQGHVTSANDSPLVRSDPGKNFIFDASINPGNSGGAIFAVRDGKFELVGITDAIYAMNNLNIGVKINPIKDIFGSDSIRCANGWKCNSSP